AAGALHAVDHVGGQRLRHETQVLVDREVAAVPGPEARGVLTAVLDGLEAEEQGRRDGVDTGDADESTHGGWSPDERARRARAARLPRLRGFSFESPRRRPGGPRGCAPGTRRRSRRGARDRPRPRG